jgi:Protein of unknown function (DUF3995)
MEPRSHRRGRAGLTAARAAFVVGAVHAAVLIYWALGGTVLLDTIGGAIEERGRAGDPMIALIVWVAVVLELTAAVLPLVAVRGLSRPGLDRLVRLMAWAEAAILTGYGSVWTVGGLLVEANIIPVASDADRLAMAWHAFVWDPWFLVWGLLVAAALLRSRDRVTEALPIAR